MNLDLQTETMVDLRINGIVKAGAVRNRTYLWTAVNLMYA